MTMQRDLTRIRHNTKIVATLGPGSNNVDLLRDMITIGGLHVVRFNFSHGTPEFHEGNAQIVREAARQAGIEVAIMADLQGPKIRVSKLENGSVDIAAGESVLFDAALEGEGNRERIGLDYRELPNDVKPGDVLLLDDGLLTVTVEKVSGSEIHTIANNSHKLKSNKGINKQGGGLSAGAFTEKDFRDLKTAVKIGCDYLAVSFVKNAEDMNIARRAVAEECEKLGLTIQPGLVSKIERIEAIENLDEIILASDGIMVARGDLAVEVGNAAVPALQKRMIKRARELRRFSITATQMMESMITNPVPTRAEVSDVANAVLDGTDAVMCSAETAVGAYPFETVRQMSLICAAAEKEQDSLVGVDESAVATNGETPHAIASSAVHVAKQINAKAIVALTESGNAAFHVSRYGILVPIYALTPSTQAQRRMAMYRGVRPIKLETSTEHNQALREAEASLVNLGVLQSRDQYVITCGSRMRETGGTDSLQVATVA
ncbi:pyruvate kinase [Kingella negevensis]|uniref:Pyruvate kinase n=1 Tax=Kingella negevensis TaxID=1522312 RepID=A0A238HFS5_9NEIS|nr:pyruvate kinase [Kingella negevensis]MDK4681281.1 pyruvate kinase [Kingella negevensis]MDK4683478.1 pyruvate kinase [Kingella negevensis]MDK4684076.1 pyruvate kinase [Kingella negevensis]MDK4689126.1 pyruvate kinase [Kingella negevensis]MDK4691387.1 pyruvate kinase [Kingella negevensis]